MTRNPRLVVLYLGLLALIACACSNVNPTTTASANGPGVTHVYVALGENGSSGLRFRSDLTSTWVQSFYRSALGTTGTLYDLSQRGETIADALDNLLPEALAAHPDLVTVWVSTEDIVSGTPLATYGDDLSQLVEAFRHQGATVLLANAALQALFPALESCPSDNDGCGPGTPAGSPASAATEVTDYDNTIASIASRTGARLVDVHAALSSALETGGAPSLLSADGASLSPRGASLLARTFLKALPARFRHSN
jgi:lysophospholipase L1-like esterase